MLNMHYIRSGCLLLACLLAACQEQQHEIEQPQQLTAVQALAGDDVEGFLRATGPRQFDFPQDHGPHPGFRNEWWYLTGNVETEGGRRFGYQVTFFSTAIRPDSTKREGCENASWCTDHIWMGHAAISDAQSGEHLAAEIFSRQNPGLAGAQLSPFRVWIQDWQLFGKTDGFPWELEVLTEDFALSLSLSPQKYPVLQGDNGLSRKSAEPGNASYYYSMTRVMTRGKLILEGETFDVSGLSWLDREWSTSVLADDQSGWDWFSLQFNDETELMYYQLRDQEGQAHANSSGNFTTLMGGQRHIDREDLQLEPLAHWQAPDGTLYDTRWLMKYGDQTWIIEAVFDDQLMDVTFQDWEGAVIVEQMESGEVVGRGYLEMVR